MWFSHFSAGMSWLKIQWQQSRPKCNDFSNSFLYGLILLKPTVFLTKTMEWKPILVSNILFEHILLQLEFPQFLKEMYICTCSPFPTIDRKLQKVKARFHLHNACMPLYLFNQVSIIAIGKILSINMTPPTPFAFIKGKNPCSYLYQNQKMA